jgi:homoserine kinase type II
VAVYTEVSDAELAGFVAGYDIGAVVSCTGMAEGIENSNYLLETTQAKYVLTLYERRVARRELPFFMGLMEHLARAGLPCPTPVAATDGTVVGTLCARPAAIVSFLDGAWPRHPTEHHCAALGRAMARLHDAGKSFAMTRRNDMALAGWDRLFEDCRKHADETTSGLIDEISDSLDSLHRDWPQDLPAGIIHADLFPDNVFFQDTRLTGIIDFYFACNDFLAYDLAIALNAWCFDTRGAFDTARSRALLSAYDGERALTAAERDALPVLCRGAALRFLLTRLHDRLFPPDAMLATPKDPAEFLARLRFHRQAGDITAYGQEEPR